MPDMITPIEGESFSDFYNRYGKSKYGDHWVDANPDSFGAKIQDWLKGDVSAARDYYNQWYNEQSARKKAQADYEYTRMLNATKYKDEFDAIKAAGMNPYMLFANAGSSTGNMSYSSSEAPQRGSTAKKSDTGAKAIGAIAIIVAALIKAVL